MTDYTIDWPEYRASLPVETVSPQRYDAVAGAWRDCDNAQAGDSPDALRVISFNTWFKDFRRDLRDPALVDLLRQCNADLVLLQEVTEELFEQLLDATWVRDSYAVVRSPFSRSSIPKHGLMLLSRWPIACATAYPLPTHMGRRLLVAEVTIGSAVLVAATTHLESMDNAPIRAEQLAFI